MNELHWFIQQFIIAYTILTLGDYSFIGNYTNNKISESSDQVPCPPLNRGQQRLGTIVAFCLLHLLHDFIFQLNLKFEIIHNYD